MGLLDSSTAEAEAGSVLVAVSSVAKRRMPKEVVRAFDTSDGQRT